MKPIRIDSDPSAWQTTGHNKTRRVSLGVLLIALVFRGPLSGQHQARGADPSADASSEAEFFEKKIRPVLVERCFECHSIAANEPGGGLLLDSAAGLRKGGESGEVVLAGRPNESRLIQALRYDGLEMPPSGKLAPAIVADFERWIANGVYDPRGESPMARTTRAIDIEGARQRWSIRPIATPAPPTIDGDSTLEAIDRYIVARLESAKLSLSPPADRRVWLRRVMIDLIGLPPTAEEVAEFLADDSAEAPAKVVDRLLASPQYGERWGRHWLDVARYADTKDQVLLFGPDRVRPYAYTYRDYVTMALALDTPYDRFIHEQLAADLIEPKVEPWRLAAMGFLTLGRLFDENPHDIYDDRIDTVTRGLLALTVACARCHDHKYDAIRSSDYYALYGVFASSEAPLESPLIEGTSPGPEADEFENQVGPKRRQLSELIETQYASIQETARERVGDYLARVATRTPDLTETAIFYLSLSPDDLRPQIVGRWRRLIEQAPDDDPVFGPWRIMTRLSDATFAAEAGPALAKISATPTGVETGQVNPLIKQSFLASPPKSKEEVARAYGAALLAAYRGAARTGASSIDSSSIDTNGAARDQLASLMKGTRSPIDFPKANTYLYMARVERGTFGSLRQEMDKLAVLSAGAPPRAMSLVDCAEPYAPRVFNRGNPSQPGEPTARRFLKLLAGDNPPPFPRGSGRLDLAESITSSDQPLAARVIANRLWMHHFGEPLASSPSDFGVRGDPPTHPELLDYLAWRLRTDGWSLKRLHREITLSKVYGQRSDDRPECRAVDPDNRLWWRAQRRRLDLESTRDSAIAVAGALDRAIGGRPVELVTQPANRRRTLYGLVDRQDLPGLYRAFDFANPDTSAERRPRTTVPQQALFLMNSPFMREQAKRLAALEEIAGEAPGEARIVALYRRLFGRPPTLDELALGEEFVKSAESGAAPRSASEPLAPWEQYAQVLLMSNEFMFVD